jgi:hypothetical protein
MKDFFFYHIEVNETTDNFCEWQQNLENSTNKTAISGQKKRIIKKCFIPLNLNYVDDC